MEDLKESDPCSVDGFENRSQLEELQVHEGEQTFVFLGVEQIISCGFRPGCVGALLAAAELASMGITKKGHCFASKFYSLLHFFSTHRIQNSH